MLQCASPQGAKITTICIGLAETGFSGRVKLLRADNKTLVITIRERHRTLGNENAMFHF